MFDLLLSADMMVPDPDAMTEKLVARLGVHRHPNWRQAFDTHPYIAHFLRVHKSLAVAPTRIEPQTHLDRPNPGDPMFHEFLESLKDYQGRHRPMQTHSIVLTLGAPAMGVLVQRMADMRLPFRLARSTPEMPFDRLWLGCTPERPRYDPSVDGGLCIEIMGTEPLQLPPETFSRPPPEPRNLAPGGMVRVSARGFLVRDLDSTLRCLSQHLDWKCDGSVETVLDEGYRRARMRFALPHSATLDVIEPTRWNGEAGRYLHSWGPGPWYIRIAVNDLRARAADLEARSTPFTWIESSASTSGRSLIRVDPACLDGQWFEFEEYRP